MMCDHFWETSWPPSYPNKANEIMPDRDKGKKKAYLEDNVRRKAMVLFFFFFVLSTELIIYTGHRKEFQSWRFER